MVRLLRVAAFVAAVVLFLLVAFTVFHGEAVTRATYIGFACFAGAFLVGELEGWRVAP